MRERAVEAARHHSLLRQQQGFAIEELFKEVRLLQCELYSLTQEHLLDLDLNAIIPWLRTPSRFSWQRRSKHTWTRNERKRRSDRRALPERRIPHP